MPSKLCLESRKLHTQPMILRCMSINLKLLTTFPRNRFKQGMDTVFNLFPVRVDLCHLLKLFCMVTFTEYLLYPMLYAKWYSARSSFNIDSKPTKQVFLFTLTCQWGNKDSVNKCTLLRTLIYKVMEIGHSPTLSHVGAWALTHYSTLTPTSLHQKMLYLVASHKLGIIHFQQTDYWTVKTFLGPNCCRMLSELKKAKPVKRGQKNQTIGSEQWHIFGEGET